MTVEIRDGPAPEALLGGGFARIAKRLFLAQRPMFFPASIIPVLLTELSECGDGDDERKEALLECSRAICGSTETVGVNWLISEIASKTGSDKASVRKESCRMFEFVCTERK